jgi:transcriptional regulator with PAS, ATPase and Fis domain
MLFKEERMINILFCIPYPEIQPDILNILSVRTSIEEIKPVFMCSANTQDFEASVLGTDCDVIVARGMITSVLRARPDIHIPVIELQVSSSDIVRTIQKCRKSYACSKIAVVAPAAMSYAAKAMAALSDFPIEVYYLQDYRDIESIVTNSLQAGCDAIVGGTTACNYAKSIGVSAVMIENSDESLSSAIEEAVRSVDLQRKERTQTEFLNVIMNNYKEGIVVIDSKRHIQTINACAGKIIGASESTCLGTDIQMWFPDLSCAIADALDECKTTRTELFLHHGYSYFATIIPVIMHGETISVILCLEDIKNIQKNEEQIRNKLHSRGLLAGYTFDDIIHTSNEFQKLIIKAKRFAAAESNVLITGETGVGKELFAQSIHNHSRRRGAPFVAVNCAALPEALLESELFGYSKGAFTGASKEGKQGLFEMAHNGTVFLDEISEMPLLLQSKLLRVIQEKEVRRIGDNKLIPVNVRVIAATNKNLYELIRQNLFRQDLYYRLAVLDLNIMPLREHPNDIVPLFEVFLSRIVPPPEKCPHLTEEARALLLGCAWEGNIRELQNIAERVLALNEKPFIDAQTLRPLLPACNSPVRGLDSHAHNKDAECIINALARSGSRKEAARCLGISRSTLWRKIREYGIIYNQTSCRIIKA